MFTVVHITAVWPSVSQTFVERDIADSLECSDAAAVFAFKSDPRVTSNFANCLDCRLFQPVRAVQTVLLHPFRSIRILRRTSHGLRNRILELLLASDLEQWLEAAQFRGNLILHAHFASRPLRVATIVQSLHAENNRVKVVVTAHAGDVLLAPNKTQTGSDLRSASMVICASKKVQSKVLELSGKLGVLRYCSVEKPSKSWQYPQMLKDSPLKVITIARLDRQKGLIHCLEAAKLLRDRGFEFEWTIVGDGPLRPLLQAFIDSESLKQVRMVGSLPHFQTLNLLEESMAFVLPAVATPNSTDGLPVALLEAMIRGIPSVSTATAAIPEVLTDSTGWVVSASDTEIANALQTIARDFCDSLRVASAGKRIVEDLTDVERNRQLLSESYQEAVRIR